MNIKKLSRFGFILIALVMFFFSSQPGDESNYFSDSVAEVIHIESDGSYLHVSVQPLLIGLNLRKIAHIAIFATLGALAFLSQDLQRMPGKRAAFAILISYAYACFDELHQSFVPDRSGSFGDTVIDLIGVLLGVFFILAVRQILISKFRTAVYKFS